MQLTIVIICVSILFSEPDELFGESNFTTHWCQKDEMKFQNELKVQLQVVFHEEGLSVYQQNTMPVIDCIMRLEALYDVIKDLPGVTSIFNINLSRWVYNLMHVMYIFNGDIPAKIYFKKCKVRQIIFDVDKQKLFVPRKVSNERFPFHAMFIQAQNFRSLLFLGVFNKIRKLSSC